jgi:acyl-CoA reductase-like NAD-dependent aldehyde dehydrogenase
LLFGDASTTEPWVADPRVQLHGPGWSKVVLGEDVIDDWPEYLDVMLASVCDNGGRSCVNASTIVVPTHADEIAGALARRMAAIEPRAMEDPGAELAAFANPNLADALDAKIEAGLATPVAEDVTALQRAGPRKVALAGSTFLRPTLIRCDSPEHPLARTEMLFPFASVLEVPQSEIPEALGPSLVVTAITRDRSLIDRLLRCPQIDRLNLGPIPTSTVAWDQPHEGNLFEFLYRRRAIQSAAVRSPASR